MSWIRKLGLLPHEWFFSLFLLITWVRLIVAAGPLDSGAILYLALMLINGVLIFRCVTRETRGRWYARLWFYPVVINVVFMTMGPVAMKVVAHRRDALLQGIDTVVAGMTPSLRAQPFVTPWLTEILSFCYLLFFPYLFLSWALYSWRGVESFRRLSVGLFTIYAFGFLGYSTVPAAGPYVALADQFTVPLSGFAITKLNASIVAHGSNGVDVFPSLHCAVSCYLLFFDRRYARRRFFIYVAPCVGLWLATIYLRYHYLVDVLVGFGLAGFGLWLTAWWGKREGMQGMCGTSRAPMRKNSKGTNAGVDARGGCDRWSGRPG